MICPNDLEYKALLMKTNSGLMGLHKLTDFNSVHQRMVNTSRVYYIILGTVVVVLSREFVERVICPRLHSAKRSIHARAFSRKSCAPSKLLRVEVRGTPPTSTLESLSRRTCLGYQTYLASSLRQSKTRVQPRSAVSGLRRTIQRFNSLTRPHSSLLGLHSITNSTQISVVP